MEEVKDYGGVMVVGVRGRVMGVAGRGGDSGISNGRRLAVVTVVERR